MGVNVLPVDSEHSAIHQCLGDGRELERLTITASGGPFRTATLDEMRLVSPAEAAAHPNWAMGIKNSIDSATLMNKALEFIEAAYLFDVPAEMIDVIIHRQSIIHGMAHFTDGSVIAQLGRRTCAHRFPMPLAGRRGCRHRWNAWTLPASENSILSQWMQAGSRQFNWRVRQSLPVPVQPRY